MQAEPTLRDATAATSAAELEQAFLAFNQMSRQLDSAYADLEKRVEQLTVELAEARSKRLLALADKERLADKLGTLMDSLPGAVVVIDRDGSIEDCNRAATDLLGKTLPGESWQARLARIATPAPGYQGEFHCTDGRRLAVAYSELSDHDARIAMITDVTETYRQSTVAHREQRLRELGDMAARLAHQVRTPLHSALLYLSHLDSRHPETAARVDAAQVGQRAKQQLRKIERLVESTLSFIRGASQGVAPLSLNTLAEECAAALQPQLDELGGELSLALPQPELLLNVQRESLENALANLLDNALQACEQQPRIHLSLRLSEGEAQLRVSDNGAGVPAELRERIFDPWFTRRPHGTGLGLAVAVSAVEQHGGRLLLEDSSPAGSTFLLALPLDCNTRGNVQ